MNFTPEQLTEAKAAKSAEELLALAKENGVEMTEEEAAKRFAEFHKEGELSDEEMENASGGSFCYGGRSYSSDPPYYLITTAGNTCSLYEERTGPSHVSIAVKGTCWYCKYAYAESISLTYCQKRTYGNDPLNQ